MKLFDFDGQEGRFQRIAQAYANGVRGGIYFATWTIIALASLGAAFVAVRFLWSLLMLALRLIARI